MEKNPVQPSRASRLRVRAILLLMVCLALGLSYRHWFGPPSPEQVRDQAIHALETGNIEELCRLADPEELQKLHLTPQSVNAVLRETIWANGYPRFKNCKTFTSKPADRRIWLIEWNETPHLHPLDLNVLDDLHVGWRLNLSDLLFCAYYQDKSFDNAGAAYHSKFIGSRTDTGNYRFFDAPNK